MPAWQSGTFASCSPVADAAATAAAADGGFLVPAFGQQAGSGHRTDQWLGQQRAPHAFHQRAHVAHAEAQPFAGLRRNHAQPAEVGDLLPDITIQRNRLVAYRPGTCDSARSLCEFRRAVGNHAGVIGHCNVGHHFPFAATGRPSTRVAMMVRWTSFVPP
jgi:hypothetical protein